jgi:hypothetical protein
MMQESREEENRVLRPAGEGGPCYNEMKLFALIDTIGRWGDRQVCIRRVNKYLIKRACAQVDWWTDEAQPAAEVAAKAAAASSTDAAARTTLFRCESLLSVPVRAGGRPDGAIVGVLQACNRLRSKGNAAAAAAAKSVGGGGGGWELDPEGFGEADERLLAAFASAVGIGTGHQTSLIGSVLKGLARLQKVVEQI